MTNINGRLSRLSAPVRGALLMTGAALGFSVMTAIIRVVSEELHSFEIAFFRNAFALAFITPWVMKVGLRRMRTARLHLHFGRSLVGLTAMLCWFAAVATLPLAEAVSLNFTTPLFATAGAALLLSENVGIRRWSATLVGFLGVLVILRPGFESMSVGMLLPIGAALFMAAANLMVKTLTRSEDPNVMVVYLSLFLTPMSFVPALFVWQTPSWEALGLMALIGLTAMLSHLLLVRAFAQADASAIVPFDYARLPFVAALAFLLFGEVPDIWTWVGAAIIASAAIYIVRREARLGRPAGVRGELR